MRSLLLIATLALIVAPACSDTGSDARDTISGDVEIDGTGADSTDGETGTDADAVGSPDATDAIGDATESDTAADAAEDASDDSRDDAVDGSGDVAADVGGDTDSDVSDGSGEGVVCSATSIAGPWGVEFADDVSISYGAPAADDVPRFQDDLSILFERYAPGPDVGTFDLGVGDDANFGTCRHCVFMRGPSSVRALYADRGTLTVNADPYSRTLDIAVSDLRLIEVDVDLETRTSTPVPGGDCVEIADFRHAETFPPAGWTCPAAAYDDGLSCECTCGAFDPDCDGGFGCPPFDPFCEPEPALPVSDCTEQEICGFDTATEGPGCLEVCDWSGRSACAEGTCTPSTGSEEVDTCLDHAARFDPAVVGEFCVPGRFQKFCAVEDGFALGYCDPSNRCRPICATSEACTEGEETCQFFLGEDGLGYCGTFPEDG